jgi:transposase-like protein
MGTKEKISDSDRLQFWQRVIAARRESELSVAAFCQKEGISEAAYYYWRKKLAGGGMPKTKEKSSPAFLEVVMSRHTTIAFELALSSGHTFRIHHGADHQMLREVLLVLQQVGLC